MAVRTRQDYFPCDTRIDTVHIVPASKLVSGITGFPVQPNKAIVGANAFAHESGIHQDGVLKHRETYEIMRAEDVGWNANKLVLGKLSGRNAFRTRLVELGIDVTDDDIARMALFLAADDSRMCAAQDFIADFRPSTLPIVAPVPAPTTPSGTSTTATSFSPAGHAWLHGGSRSR